MTELVDYPIGIQVLFKQVREILERLDRMEMDYRAWQASEAGRAWEKAQTDEPTLLLGVPCLLTGRPRAEQARLRWEAVARTACPPQTGGDEKANL